MASPDRNFANSAIFTQTASGTTPNAGDSSLYFKTDGYLYSKKSSGAESLVSNLPVFEIFDHIVSGTTNFINLSSLVSGGGSMASSSNLYNSIGVGSLTTGANINAAYSAVGVNPVAGQSSDSAKVVDLGLADRNIFSSRCAFTSLPNATATGHWYSGFINKFDVVSTYGAYFRIQNAGNLACVAVNNSVETTFDCGVIPALNTMNLYEVVVRGSGTAVDFYYNSVLQTTLTTNIPTGATKRVNYGVGIAKTLAAGTAVLSFDLDLVFLRLGNSGFNLNT